DRLSGELRNLERLAHVGDQRETRAAADIAAKPNFDRPAWVARVAHAKKAAAQERVGGRTVGKRGAALVTAAELRLIKVDPMRIDGGAADQAVMVVHIEIVATFRKGRADKFDLTQTFGNVALHEYVGMLAPERGGSLELLRCARAGKPRGDRIERAALAMPA